MARPAKQDLTDRELDLMQAFWRCGEMTAQDARDQLADQGLELTYVTVANLPRALVEKNYLESTNDQRPFRYRPVRTFDEAARSFVGNFVDRVFGGSREQLLVNLFGRRKKLTHKERALLEQILKDQSP
jgi:predicted transcriptional regulator